MRVLLVHGALTTSAMWRSVAALLARDLAPAAIDAHALSGHPAGTTRESIGAYAEEIVADVGPGTWLVGYAMGAAVVLEAACTSDRRPAGLILVNASARMRVDPRLIEGAVSDPRAQAAQIWTSATTSAVARRVLLEEADRLDSHTVADDLRVIDCWSRLGELSSLVGLPNLVIGGRADSFVSERHAMALAHEIQAAFEVVPGGHCLPVESPDVLARLIADFICRRQTGGISGDTSTTR